MTVFFSSKKSRSDSREKARSRKETVNLEMDIVIPLIQWMKKGVKEGLLTTLHTGKEQGMQVFVVRGNKKIVISK